MAAPAEMCRSRSQLDDLRKHRFHHPTVWGDFFLDFRPCTPSQYLSMKAVAEVKVEEVRKMIIDCGSANLPIKLELVDTLERLGLDYHYQEEIDELLYSINDAVGEDCDLHTTALRFYLLRKHGYHVSPDVFLKFKDEDGYITSNDTRSMLSLYNAAHLRIHGEELLDNAITSTKNHLQSVMAHLPSPLAEEAQYALETPLFRRLRRVEARHYISVYEKLSTRNETILEFAKLDFSMLQALYCEELKKLTLWWKELELQNRLSFARDRMVEMHFWILGLLFEPQYSYARIMFTKLIQFLSIFDDINDNYSTLEECTMLTIAMERWDEQAAENLPGYMKLFYNEVLITVKAIEEELKLRGNKNADYVKKVREQESLHVISTVETYMKENGITIELAYKKLRELIEEYWMDISEECLRPTAQPMPLMETVVNSTRALDFIYKHEDSYTVSYTVMKSTITSLYVDSI